MGSIPSSGTSHRVDEPGAPRFGSYLPTVDATTDAILNSFLDAVTAQGLTLYPAQEQGILEVIGDRHVILSTPTGSGKTLVATALQFRALAQGRRVFYTAPIKALVSEKFFDLCRDFGADKVGMLTGDASINRDAPLVCCTAEILANMALREGDKLLVDDVVMDEFHYYGDADRGVAWQLPLLLLRQTRFLLMSATLGDTSAIEQSLRERTGRESVVVRSRERPVPLDFVYREIPVHETLADLLLRHLAPVYVVSFSQREAAEQAQDLLSTDFLSKEAKAAIAAELRTFRFDTPFGKTMQRLVRHGLGLHHAGLLPKYRRLVEQLAQQGHLKIICGTDTLGVGVNIPIRTVLLTKLSKYDGTRVALLTARDFHQIAGRAGRKGFDDRGSVVCQAPEHIIENKRIDAVIAGDPTKKKKLQKRKPPQERYVGWNEATFLQLVGREPEPLRSSFRVTHGMLLDLLQGHEGERPGGYGVLVDLIAWSHESRTAKARHRRHAARLLRALRGAGIVSLVVNRQRGSRLVLNQGLQRDFSLHQTLALYLVEALGLLDPEALTYGYDVLTLVEAILENPHAILNRQTDRAKGARVAELKAAGVPYEERMVELEKVEYPKPLRDFIYDSFNAFARRHPWVGEENIRPKSIAREMVEGFAAFGDYVRDYGLERSEGVLLRYLSDAYRTLVQSVPSAFVDERVEEVAIYLRTLLGSIDNSLVLEWEALAVQGATPSAPEAGTLRDRELALLDPRRNPRGFAVRVRTELHRLVEALSRRDYETASSLARQSEDNPWGVARFEAELGPFFVDYERLIFDHGARLREHTRMSAAGEDAWRVVQVLVDPAGDNQWAIHATVHRDDALEVDAPLLRLERIGI